MIIPSSSFQFADENIKRISRLTHVLQALLMFWHPNNESVMMTPDLIY